MKNLWLKIGCFLTGHKYSILIACSEASSKTVKKYTSALLIVIILWAFIGYILAQTYLKLDIIESIGMAIILVVIVVQIERQIILTVHKNKKIYFARFIIAMVMAILGSVIIDQIIFKDDINKLKISKVQEEVERLLPYKLKDINNDIVGLDSALNAKEREKWLLIAELNKNPTIMMPTSSIKKSPGKYKRLVNDNGVVKEIEDDTIYVETLYTSSAVQNPQMQLLPQIDEQIKVMNERRNQLLTMRLNIRENLEKELTEKVGFLDELETMFQILASSWIFLCFWVLWFIFFFAIEMFVLISKSEKGDDYDVVIKHQLDIRLAAIKELAALKQTQ